MAKKRIDKNPLTFQKGYFALLAQQKLKPCEFRCLLALLEGEEHTKAQIAIMLSDTPQHVGSAMIHLERLGMVIHTRTEGRNNFFKINTNLTAIQEAVIDGQLTLNEK